MAEQSASNLFYRFGKIGEKYLLTNDYGRYQFLDTQQFSDIVLRNRVKEDLWKRLEEDLFVLNKENLQRATDRYSMRKDFLRYGPFLHMLVVTLRCNHSCRYCQVSRAPMSAEQTDMDIPTAKACVDRIFETTSPFISIEFQGGEPMVNFETMKFVIDYAREKNETEKKTLNFSLVSTLSLLTEEIVDKLVAPDINICTSIDGLKLIHNKHRKFRGDAYQKSVDGINWINSRYRELGWDSYYYKVNALLTTTKDCLPHYKEIIDNYIDLGMHVIHLRPLQPFGFATHSWKNIGYSSAEFIDFYRKSLDYLIELNKQGVEILEKTANLILMKLYSDFDPNFVDLRNPSGDAIGGMAYNYDGNVFVSDEGRMIYEMGDDAFHIGHVAENSLAEMLSHDTVKSMIVASTLDNQPECSQCVYNAYCGVCPTYNYVEQGDIFGQMATNERCKKLKGIFGYMFEKLLENDPVEMEIFRRWAAVRLPDEIEEETAQAS